VHDQKGTGLIRGISGAVQKALTGPRAGRVVSDEKPYQLVEPFRFPDTVEFALQPFHDLTEQRDRPLLIVDLFGRETRCRLDVQTRIGRFKVRRDRGATTAAFPRFRTSSFLDQEMLQRGQ